MRRGPGDAVERRGGFTLVELLVVIAIIGILVGVLLPAVQSARECGRQTQCKNNLKQMSLAFQTHVAAQGCYPDAGNLGWVLPWFINGAPATSPKQCCGWTYQILPYIEQDALWQLSSNTNPDCNSSQGGCEAAAAPANVTRYKTAIPTYCCPTRGPVRVKYDSVQFIWQWRAMCDYAGNGGIGVASMPDPCGNAAVLPIDDNGPLVRNGNSGAAISGVVSPANIAKGASVTLLLGEKVLNHDCLWGFEIDDSAGWLSGWSQEIVRWGNFQPLADYHRPCAMLECGGSPSPWANDFGSAHVNSCNFAMCDGSVRSIRYSVSPQVLDWLSVRDLKLLSPGAFPPGTALPVPAAGIDY
jgi:prepilin-type N-terminal cleavage/methylation domain-containing protein/prepilin-type processing-associated H-X9-DG protein